MAKFSIQQAVIHGTSRPGIRGYVLDRGVEVDSDGSDGTIHETIHTDLLHRPSADLTTLAAHTMIGSVLTGSSEFPLLALNGTTGIVLYGAEAGSAAPGYASGSTHVSKTALNGVLYLASLRWSFGSNLEAAIQGMFRSTGGTTDAITTSTAAALPSAPTPTERLTLTSLTLAGDDVTSVQSLELTIDPKAEHVFDTGQPHPVDITMAGVNGPAAIRLSAEAEDMDLGDGTGTVTAVFTKRAQGGGLGADTLTVSLNAGWSVERSWGGDHGSPMSRRLEVHPRHDGSTRPLTITAA